MSEELLKIADGLLAVSEGVRALAGKAHSCNCSKNQEEGRVQKDEESGNEKSQEKQEDAVTIEQVRAVMASKSQDGKTQQVKALIQKYGADKLSGYSRRNMQICFVMQRLFNGTACDIIRICLQTMDELYPICIVGEAVCGRGKYLRSGGNCCPCSCRA